MAIFKLTKSSLPTVNIFALKYICPISLSIFLVVSLYSNVQLPPSQIHLGSFNRNQIISDFSNYSLLMYMVHLLLILVILFPFFFFLLKEKKHPIDHCSKDFIKLFPDNTVPLKLDEEDSNSVELSVVSSYT